jgi:lysophospholipase L1-like esterase
MNAAVVAMPARARWALRAMIVMICALGLLAATSGSALAKKHTPKGPTITTHTPITRGSTYLALGDSVTFGYEEKQVVPAPNYADASSFLGYPELMGSALHLNVVNAACPGETSSSFINPAAQSNGCENTPIPGGPVYRAMFPLHASYSGSQLAFAISYLKKHHDVRLVSLMIGANDGLVCEETTADHCASELGTVIATVSNNVKTILSTVRSKAHYRGQLGIVNYYDTDQGVSAEITELNQVIDTAAAPFHVVIADGFGEFEAAAAHSGGSTCKAGLLTQLVGTTSPCGIHPSYAGQSLLAHAVEKAIRLG